MTPSGIEPAACSAVPQSTAPPRAPSRKHIFKKLQPKCYIHHLFTSLFLTPHVQANLSSVPPLDMTHIAPSFGVAEGAGNLTLQRKT